MQIRLALQVLTELVCLAWTFLLMVLLMYHFGDSLFSLLPGAASARGQHRKCDQQHRRAPRQCYRQCGLSSFITSHLTGIWWALIPASSAPSTLCQWGHQEVCSWGTLPFEHCLLLHPVIASVCGSRHDLSLFLNLLFCVCLMLFIVTDLKFYMHTAYLLIHLILHLFE